MADHPNIEIGEVRSTLRLADSQALLDPRMVDRLADVLIRKVRDRLDHERRVRDETELRPGASARQTTNWT